MMAEIFEATIALDESKQELFLKQAYDAIKFGKETGVSPYFRVVNKPGIPPRPVLYEDEKCIVLSSDDPSKYYFKVIPRKPISTLPLPNMEENDILLKEHLMCVAKNLANEYGLADVINMCDHGNGFYGSRFYLQLNLYVSSKNYPIDPASVSFEEYEYSIPATYLEMVEEIEELKNAFQEYYIMGLKYNKFFTLWSNPLMVEWRAPEDADMRAVNILMVLQYMFPFKSMQYQPFSYYEANLPHYILEVEQLEENAYQTANSPSVYSDKIEDLISDIYSMFKEKYHLPGYLEPGSGLDLDNFEIE